MNLLAQAYLRIFDMLVHVFLSVFNDDATSGCWVRHDLLLAFPRWIRYMWNGVLSPLGPQRVLVILFDDAISLSLLFIEILKELADGRHWVFARVMGSRNFLRLGFTHTEME
jgi:hypothetical protein